MAQAQSIDIVTGAASGMGAAAARLLGGSDNALLLCDVNEAGVASVAAEIGAGVETLVCDLSDPRFADQLVAALAGRTIGRLIHCAGISPTMDNPAMILEVNLAATLRLVAAVRRRMAEGGAVVLFASSAGYMMGRQLDEQIGAITRPEDVSQLLAYAPESGSAYSISKRGVHLLVRREAAAFGAGKARIISVSPGIIDTPMGRAEMAKQPQMAKLVATSALQRPAAAEEVAAAAVFLASPAASFITGIDLPVDGGSLAAVGAL